MKQRRLVKYWRVRPRLVFSCVPGWRRKAVATCSWNRPFSWSRLAARRPLPLPSLVCSLHDLRVELWISYPPYSTANFTKRRVIHYVCGRCDTTKPHTKRANFTLYHDLDCTRIVVHALCCTQSQRPPRDLPFSNLDGCGHVLIRRPTTGSSAVPFGVRSGGVAA